eukprot:10570099-Alexandrium_andersonii.AAC.1
MRRRHLVRAEPQRVEVGFCRCANLAALGPEHDFAAPRQAVLGAVCGTDAVNGAAQQPSLAVLCGVDVVHRHGHADLHPPSQQELQLIDLPQPGRVEALGLVDQQMHIDPAPRHARQLVREAACVER